VPRGTLDEFRRHLREIAQFARAHGTKPVFMVETDADGDTLERAVKRKPYVRAMAEEAERLHVQMIDTFSLLAEPQGQWVVFDYIHPTRLGNELIASQLASALLKNR
jgi:lysophospholipase L1-like esterase